MNLRHHRSLLAAVALAVVLGAAAHAAAGPDARAVPYRTRTMGTWATLTLVTPDSAASADLAYTALMSLHRTDSLMTNWTTTSEVARVNRVAGQAPTVADPEVFAVLARAREVSIASGGAFDVTVEPLVRLWGFLQGTPHVPEAAAIDAARADVDWRLVRLDPTSGMVGFVRPGVRIDFGGIAKGYGVDQVAAILDSAQVTDALIDLSGNMVARGSSPGHDGWVVGIRDPEDRQPYLATVTLHDEAIATSGAYQQFVDAGGKRYGHILDPRTGWPASGLLSATVVSRAGIDADAFATACFVLGLEKAKELAAKRDDIAVVLAAPGPDGRTVLWVERPLADRVAVSPAAAAFTDLAVF